MSAIEYDFMSSLINNKKQEIEQKNEIKGIPPLPSVSAFSGSNNMFALGGDYQTNGSDFTTGMTHIDAGGSHEENPNEGVQMGVDREGTPNLVEEGETVFNDYVYSNRIELDDKAKEAFHVNKKHKIAYSDFSKKLEKESVERPNDPISQAGLKAQLEDLAEHQERQKQEMEEKRAQEAFDTLTPEEQAGLMQYAQEQEQEQQIAQEQAAQEQMMQQMSPEEQAMMQQQMADGSTPNLEAEPQMSAYGGNLYAGGGILDLLNILGYADTSEAEKAGWKPSDFGDFNSWDAITKESKLSDGFTWSNDFASRVTSPTAKAALSLGWNPLAEALTSSWYEGSSGNDLSWGPSARKKKFNKKELEEIASRYPYTIGKAIEQGYIKSPEGNNTISSKEIVEGARKTEDRKKTDEWLQDKANKIAYLGRVRKLAGDDPAFQKAWSPYGNFVQNGDSWAFNLVNENPVVNGKALPSFSDYFWTSRNDDAIGNMHDSMHTPGSAVKRYTLDDNGNPVLLEDNDLSKYEQIGDYTWGDAAKDLNNQALFYRLKGNNPKTYHAVIGDDDWHLENELDWSKVGDEVRRETLPNNEGVVIYHAGKGPGADETVKPGTAGDARKIVPVHRNENLRYAGLFGPAIGLGMQALGLEKPDTSKLDASLKMTNDLAFAKPYLIGDYMKYNPLDRLFYSNQLQANSRATDRGIMNTSGGNRGAAMAGLIANGYNTNNNLGNLYRQAEEYNRGQYERTKEFNRGTNQFNAQTLTQNSQFNADAYNRNRQFAAQMAANVANQKMDADAGWWNGIYGNIGGLFKGIGDLGRENYQHNRIADMAATGLFGTMKPETFVSNGYLRYEDEDPTWLRKRSRKRSRGGEINRKKGGK